MLKKQEKRLREQQEKMRRDHRTELEQVVRNLQQQLRELSEGSKGKAKAGTAANVAEDRRLRLMFDRGYITAEALNRGSQPDQQRRLMHLRAAIENLEAGGFRDQARQLEEHSKRMHDGEHELQLQHDHNQSHGNNGPTGGVERALNEFDRKQTVRTQNGRPTGANRGQSSQEVKQLRNELQRIRAEMDEMRKLLKQVVEQKRRRFEQTDARDPFAPPAANNNPFGGAGGNGDPFAEDPKNKDPFGVADESADRFGDSF